MSQTSSIEISGCHIPINIESDKVKKLQKFIDILSVTASMLDYKINIDSVPHGNYHTINFVKEENSLRVYFQHSSIKGTTCYCLHNDKEVSLSELIKLF